MPIALYCWERVSISASSLAGRVSVLKHAKMTSTRGAELLPSLLLQSRMGRMQHHDKGKLPCRLGEGEAEGGAVGRPAVPPACACWACGGP